MKFAFFTRLLTALVFLNVIFYSNLTLVANAQGTTQPKQKEVEQPSPQGETENLQEPPESISTTTIVINEEQLEEILNTITSEPESPRYGSTITTIFTTILGGVVGAIGTFFVLKTNRKELKKERDDERVDENRRRDDERADENRKRNSERVRERLRAKEKAEIELTYQVMKEWDSYREERVIADDIFVTRLRKKIEDKGEDPSSDEIIYQNMPPFHDIPYEDRLYMNRILDFFDRLNMLKKKDLINTDLATQYLSEDFTQWWNNYIKFQKGFDANPPIETEADYIKGFEKLPNDWLLNS